MGTIAENLLTIKDIKDSLHDKIQSINHVWADTGSTDPGREFETYPDKVQYIIDSVSTESGDTFSITYNLGEHISLQRSPVKVQPNGDVHLVLLADRFYSLYSVQYSMNGITHNISKNIVRFDVNGDVRVIDDFIIDNDYCIINIAPITSDVVITASAQMEVYEIEYTVENANLSNSVTDIRYADTYTTKITPKTDYAVSRVFVTMGGIDITASSYNQATGTITIPRVTANIGITVLATELVYHNIIYRLQGVSSTESAERILAFDTFTTELNLVDQDNYKAIDVSVFMNGIEDTTSWYKDGIITIPAVDGTIIITAEAVPYDVYLIEADLVNATLSNPLDSIDERNDGYQTSIIYDAVKYNAISVVIYMGTTDISATAFQGNQISIPKITDDVLILVEVSSTIKTFPVTYDLTGVTVTNTQATVTDADFSYSNQIIVNTAEVSDDYALKVTVTMGPTDISDTYNPETGEILIYGITGPIQIVAIAVKNEYYDVERILVNSITVNDINAMATGSTKTIMIEAMNISANYALGLRGDTTTVVGLSGLNDPIKLNCSSTEYIAENLDLTGKTTSEALQDYLWVMSKTNANQVRFSHGQYMLNNGNSASALTFSTTAANDYYIQSKASGTASGVLAGVANNNGYWICVNKGNSFTSGSAYKMSTGTSVGGASFIRGGTTQTVGWYFYELDIFLEPHLVESHFVSQTLSHVTSSNNLQVQSHGSAWQTTLSLEDGYSFSAVTVSIGGIDATEECWDPLTNTINVTVLEDVSIIAIAEKPTDANIAYTLSNVTSSNKKTIYPLESLYTTTLLYDTTKYNRLMVTVLMNGIDITDSVFNKDTNKVTIASLEGDVVIDARAINYESSITIGQVILNTDTSDIVIDDSSLDQGIYTLKYIDAGNQPLSTFGTIGTFEV